MTVALTTYTIRDHVRTREDFTASMQRVKAIGFDAVQISQVKAPDADGADATAAELRTICDDAGLPIAITHEAPFSAYRTDPAFIRQRVQDQGSSATAYCWPEQCETPADYRALAADLNACGAHLRAAGIRLGYHNHALEFQRTDGELPFQILVDELDPTCVDFELDLIWLIHAGCDPYRWLQKLAGRVPWVHLKDFTIQDQWDLGIRPIGDGNLDWANLIPALQDTGVEDFIVEIDRDWPQGDPWIALERSHAFLRRCGL